GHSAADAPDQYRLARDDLRPRHDHAPGGERDQGECRRLGPGERSRECRDGDDVLVGHYDILRHRSGQVLAQNAVAATQRLLAGAAVLARIVGDARIDHDPVARPYQPDLGPDGIHDTGAIRAHDVGEAVFVGQPAHYEQVEVVERRGARRHADLPRAQG